MQLIVIHGWPGVGKLTVARELAAQIGYPLFHNHLTVDLVEAVFPFGSQPFVELRELIWLAVFRRAVEARLPGLIFTFVFEQTVREHFLADLLHTVESGGGCVYFAELTCQRAEWERRVVSPARAAFTKLRSVERLEQIIASGALHIPPLPRPNFVVDTTALSPQATAHVIAEHFNLKRTSNE